jgi:hypothetical protein
LVLSTFPPLCLILTNDIVEMINLKVFRPKPVLKFLIQIDQFLSLPIQFSSSPFGFLELISVVPECDVQSLNFRSKDDKLILILSYLPFQHIALFLSLVETLQFLIKPA